MNIMILLEEKKQRQLLADSLNKMGYCIYKAFDVHEAIRVWQEKKVRIVIADWHNKNMDCATFCRMIRERERIQNEWYTYITVLTAKSVSDEIVKAFEAGADDYLTKPIMEQELLVRLTAGRRILSLHEELLDKKAEIKNLNDQLERMGLTDMLTGLGNRRQFYEVATKFHQLAIRHNKYYGLIFYDIDFFKSYNDTYGSQSGDIVLQEVTQEIKTLLRNSDEVFRFGGEEFVIILPEQDIDGTLKAAEKICKAVYDKGKEHSQSSFGTVTVSCGVSAFEPGIETWEEVLALADKALYEAKEAGRNCAKKKN